MDYRVVWVHGIGHQPAGYSKAWENAFNTYLQFPQDDYIEVLWSVVFDSFIGNSSLGMNEITIPLTPQEQLAEAEVRKALTTQLLARAVPMQTSGLVGEWSELINEAAANEALLPNWVLHPDQYLGEFVKYLVSRPIRNAVKERAKQQLRTLANSAYDCSIIAHSWGSVVAYESLIDLEMELPTFRLANLFTLGSPLWLVQPLLDDRSGRKPRNVGRWVNVHAQGDLIGSWLKPGFQVDQDYAVPNFGGGDAHESYFVVGNMQVQHDIVAADVPTIQAFDLVKRLYCWACSLYFVGDSCWNTYHTQSCRELVYAI